jgi:hypothetical protein
MNAFAFGYSKSRGLLENINAVETVLHIQKPAATTGLKLRCE